MRREDDLSVPAAVTRELFCWFLQTVCREADLFAGPPFLQWTRED